MLISRNVIIYMYINEYSGMYTTNITEHLINHRTVTNTLDELNAHHLILIFFFR